jgi:hypothetical protein
MVLSGSFFNICAAMIQIIIIQNNHVKKHNNMFFFMSMLCNRVQIEMGINNDGLLKTIGEHMREIKKRM